VGKRETIYNYCKAAIDASTGVNYVTQQVNINMFGLTENLYPAVRLNDGPEIKSRFAYPSTTSEDMQSEFPISFVGYVRSINKSSTEIIDEQNNLLVAIEKALTADTTIIANVADIVPNEQVTDRGNIDGIGWVSGDYIIKYYYNHTTP